MLLKNLIKNGSTVGTDEDRKLALSFGALVLTLMLILSGVSFFLYARLQSSEEDRLAGAVAAILSESISQVSFSGKYHARLFVEEMKNRIPAIYSISVETPDGLIVAHSDPLLNDTMVSEDEMKQIRATLDKKGLAATDCEHKGITIKEITIPYHSGLDSEIAGIVRLGVNVEITRQSLIVNFLKLIALISILTFAAIWIVFILSRYFGSRMRNMAIQMLTILDSSPALIYMKDNDGRYLFVNRQWAELFNTTNDNVRGKDDLELFPEDIAAGFMANDRRVLDTGTLLEIEEYAILADGLHSYQSIKAAIRDSSGKIYALCGISTDITARKKAENELHETREIFNHFMEYSPIYVFFKDENIRTVRLSKNYEELLGIPLESIIGKTMDDLFPSDLAKSMIADDQRVLREGKIINVDEELDGKYFTTIKFPILIDGKPRYLSGYTIDITERKLNQKLIEEEREQLLVTLRSIGDAVITTNVDGNIALMNRVAEELTGWTAKEAEGMPLMDVFNIVHETTRSPGDNPAERVMQLGVITELPPQTILICRDGSERLIADSAAPIRGRDSSMVGIVLVFRDVTEKRKTEILIQNSQKLESLGVLAGGIAHDFNNLLGGMFGYLELMRIQINKNDMTKLGDTVDKAMQVFNRTRALTQQLLTFAKGGEPLKKKIHLPQLLISGTQFVLSGTRVSSTFDIQPDLWRCIADENQIGQVLDNIIINAIQAMPAGGGINIRADNFQKNGSETDGYLSAGQYVRVAISDHGPGIPQSSLSRIFDPFYTTKTAGTGLGLATCYSIIKKHGGIIIADSIEGKGSTFTFYLPASESDSDTDENRTSDAAAAGFNGGVLLMDDEDFVRSTTSDLLSTFEIHVDTAAHGEDAVEKYRAAFNAGRPYPVVILDLTVKGGMGGRETINLLKEIDPDVVAIASSGYSADPVMANPEKYGFKARIIKPYRIDEMIKVLNSVKKQGQV